MYEIKKMQKLIGDLQRMMHGLNSRNFIRHFKSDMTLPMGSFLIVFIILIFPRFRAF